MFAIQPSQWIINKKFDTVFFLGSIVAGLAYFGLLYVLPQHALFITAVVWILLAQTHFGSTWFIYFDKRNRAYYRQHPVIYYVIPAVICVAVLALGYVRPVLVALLISIASVYHVTKQNLGILQIYRVRNKEFDPRVRQAETIAIFGWTLFFAGWGAFRLQNFRDTFAAFLPLAQILVWLCLVAAVASSIIVVVQYVRRQQNSLPKTIFLLSSVLMYSPYVYAAVILVDIYQMEIATLTSLNAHYLQYMGLVWLINRNKYRETTVYGHENPLLKNITSKYRYIIGLIVGYALLMAFFRWGVPAQYAVASRLVPNIVLALTATHFYIDSFIWKFRNPFYKETVLPFVRAIEAPAVAAPM